MIMMLVMELQSSAAGWLWVRAAGQVPWMCTLVQLIYMLTVLLDEL